MLLARNDVSVSGGGYQLHDYVICRLRLRSVDLAPTLNSAVYGVISLGDTGIGEVKVPTNGFSLDQIRGFREHFAEWRRVYAEGKYEQDFFDFLLRKIPDIHLEFLVENQRMSGLLLTLGRHIQLRGRFPVDQDILSKYFGTVLESSD